MSVYLAEVVQESGRGPGACLIGHDGYGLVAITARQARDEGMKIQRAPEPDEEAHAYVVGPKPGSVRGRWARAAVWVIDPPSWIIGP